MPSSWELFYLKEFLPRVHPNLIPGSILPFQTVGRNRVILVVSKDDSGRITCTIDCVDGNFKVVTIEVDA